MAFWTTKFMENRRQQFLNALVKFEFKVENTWYEATMNSKRITGNTVEIIVSFPRTSTGKQTITAVRIIDVTGSQCGYQDIKLVRVTNQGALAKFEFPIYEKEGED